MKVDGAYLVPYDFIVLCRGLTAYVRTVCTVVSIVHNVFACVHVCPCKVHAARVWTPSRQLSVYISVVYIVLSFSMLCISAVDN